MSPRPDTLWTPDDDARLIAMRSQRVSFAAIAVALGRTERAVVARRRVLRQRGADIVSGRGSRADIWTPDMDARLLEMRAAGIVARQIGEAVGRSMNAVVKRLANLKASGVAVPAFDLTRGVTPEERKRREADVRNASKRRAREREAAARALLPKPPPRPRPPKLVVIAPEPVAPVVVASTGHEGVGNHAEIAKPVRRKRFSYDIALRPAPSGRMVRLDAFEFSSPDMPLMADRREFAAYLDAVGWPEPWSPALDLEMVEALGSGVSGRDVAAMLGLPPVMLAERFRDLSRPIRNDRGIPSTDGQAALVALLRDRAPAMQAAE